MRHISAFCRGVDRSDWCFRCGNQGHLAKECEAESSRCALCADTGRPADHRLGSGRCQTQSMRGNAKEQDSERKGDATEGKGRESGVIVDNEAMVLEETVLLDEL